MTEAGWSRLDQAEHIRSHQLDNNPELLEDPGLTQGQRHRLQGNKLADEQAAEAQEGHLPYHKEALIVDQWAHRAARVVVHLAAKVLPLHPKRARHQRIGAAAGDVQEQAASEQAQAPNTSSTTGMPPCPPTALSSTTDLPPIPPTDLPTNPPPPTNPEDLSGALEVPMGSTGDPAVHRPVTAAHQWQAINDCPGAWRCLTCGLVANTGMADPPAAGECHGKHLALSKVGDGHRLVCYKPHPRVAQQLTCFACELCHGASAA